jgi:hypothetical protein
MKKNLINEDIRKMMGLIDYDRGKTLTENKTRQYLSEQNEDDVFINVKNELAAASKGLGTKVGRFVTTLNLIPNDRFDEIIEKLMTTEMNGEAGLNELIRSEFKRGDTMDSQTFRTKIKPLIDKKSNKYTIDLSKSYDIIPKGEMSKTQEPKDEVSKTQEPKSKIKAVAKKEFIKYPCVQDTIDIASKITYPNKSNWDQVLITLENGDKMLVSTAGKYVAIIGGNKSSGTIECEGDLNLDDEELTLSESRYIFEQTFGSIKLIPKSEVAGKEVTTGTSGPSGTSGLSGSFTRTDVTYADIVAGKGEFKKGDKGEEVKKAQEELNKSNKVNPKLKVDGMFGPKTETAVGQVGGEKVFNKAVIDMLSGQSKASGEATGKAAGEEVTQQEEKKLDMVTVEKEKSDAETLKNQVKDLEQAISQQPTKEQCMDLIATAAAGIKKGVRVSDTSTLEQCYNSYNFGKIGDGSKKVKKAYGLKGKGN